MPRRLALAAFAAIALAGVRAGAAAGAADAGAGPLDATIDSDASAADGSTELQRLRDLADRVRALAEGSLDPALEPASLFEVPLEDDLAVRVEVVRLERLVGPEPPDAPAVDAGVRRDGGSRDADAEAVDAANRDGGIEAALLAARTDVDRARLAFLSLDRVRRDELLRDHAARRAEAERAQADRAIDDARRRAEDAAEARRRALDAVRVTSSDAAKLVAEERARLLGVKESQAKLDASLLAEERTLAARADTAVEWHRRVSSLVERRRDGDAGPEAADALYGELVAVLRDSRLELADEIGAGMHDADDVPGPGGDRLGVVGSFVEHADVDRLRASLAADQATLAERVRHARWASAKARLDQVESLNRDRLELYPAMSSLERDKLTSFTAEGVAQARREVEQVALVVRYHALSALAWVGEVRRGGLVHATQIGLVILALKLAMLAAAFVWWRRRSDALLAAWTVPPTVTRGRRAGWISRAAALVRRVRVPLEWLAAAYAAIVLAGPSIASLLEVRLPWIFASWTLGGAVVVGSLDAFLGASGLPRPARPRLDALRLRTLRLLGRAVVAIGVVLAIAVELVGRGTIHAWVSETCWFVAIPLAIVVVRWWRPTIVARLERQQPPTGLASWVLARRTGWRAFPAAAVGGVYLLSRGAARGARTRIARLPITRRALAYWFRREMAKQARAREERTLVPLDPRRAVAFDPDRAPDEALVDLGADLAPIVSAIGSRRGVHCLVAERGLGKSTELRRLVRANPGALHLACPPSGLGELLSSLRRRLALPEDASIDRIAEAITDADLPAVLLDDAHRIVRPIVGGLDDLDLLLSLAGTTNRKTAWLLAMDSVAFAFVERARGGRAPFDEVVRLAAWPEESIADLVRGRAASAGIDPRFDDLLVETSSDEVERTDQLQRTALGYLRLLWDYAEGNPGVALRLFGDSLRVDETGSVRVQPFAAPDGSELVPLTDEAVFVLRAVVQLEPARFDDLVEATRLFPREVEQALRHARAQRWVELDDDGRVRLSWTHYRAVTRHLERRRLLPARKN